MLLVKYEGDVCWLMVVGCWLLVDDGRWKMEDADIKEQILVFAIQDTSIHTIKTHILLLL